jgi:mono/diheme cytochrome c family protein
MLLGVSACEQAPAAESLKQWTPADHHSQDDDRAGAGRATGRLPQGPRAGGAPAGDGDIAQLVDLAWRQQCTSCHGPTGRGDGQMGPMVQAPDLSREDLQSRVTDTDMAATIRTGRNRMPKFDLPEPVVQGLVARIRSLRGR